MTPWRPKGYSGGNSVSMRPDRFEEISPAGGGVRYVTVNGRLMLAMSIGGGPLRDPNDWPPEARAPLAEEAQRRIPFPRPKAPHGGCD